MNTTAILCIARNEMPYTEQWLEHHFSLGFDRVYYISTDTDFTPVKAYFESSQYRSRVELFHFDSFELGWQTRSYNTFLQSIQEDWVLVIDIDEFLYLNSFSSIQEYLTSVADDVGQIQFPWLNVISRQYCHDHIYDILDQSGKFASDHVKSMVRRQNVIGLAVHSHGVHQLKTCLSSGIETPAKNRHRFFLDDLQYCVKYPFILHICSRGHLDVLTRIIDHQFFNEKNGPNERQRVLSYLTSNTGWSGAPTRYLLLQFYQSMPEVNVECCLPDLTSRTDVRELKDIFLQIINRVVEFHVIDPVFMDLSLENRFRLLEKTGREFPVSIKLTDYLGFDTQLAYLAKLRTQLLDHEVVEHYRS